MPSGDTISVLCTCGKKLKAPATAAGKRARCPACGNIVVLPHPEPELEFVPELETSPAMAYASEAAPQPAPTEPAGGYPDLPTDEKDPWDAMYELAEKETSGAPPAAPAAPVYQATCPKCGGGMMNGAVLCTSCGYDKRTGKTLNTAAATATKKPPIPKGGKKKPVDYMAPDGSLVLGIVFSAVFALVASALWVLVASLTGYMIGYIAIAIGVAAGIGMQVGHKGYSAKGAMIAAAMTVVAIIVAKLVVAQIYFSQHGIHVSVLDFPGPLLAMYVFTPMSVIFMLIGIGAAYRTASGSVRG